MTANSPNAGRTVRSNPPLARLGTAAALFFFAFSASFPAVLRADLGEFKKDVEQEEKTKDADSEKKDKDGGGTDDGGCLGNCCTPFFNVFWSISGDLWAVNNLSVVYQDYPYSSPDFHFMTFVDPSGPGNAGTRGRSHYFRLSGGGVWADDRGLGFEASLRGHLWKFFGPELDVRSLWDGKDVLLHSGLGFNIALFQSDPLSCDLYCQYSFLWGILARKGAATGAVFTSYPVKPLVLDMKIGMQIYQRIVFVDFSFSAGVMIGRHELYAAFDLLQSELARLTGVSTGVRVFF